MKSFTMMKTALRGLLGPCVLTVACLAHPAAASERISLRSLLEEMTDEDALARLPDVPFTTRLWSSHDRHSVSPGRPGWFANLDANEFLRCETNAAGKVERVLLDAKGPGAIVRFWMTVVNVPNGGIIRFYVDGEKVVEGKAFDVVSGTALCGAPLADSLSPRTPKDRRGHNLYLPIPYAKSCKVTVEGELPRSNSFYYNIETRTYAAGTEVESFSPAALAACSGLVARVNAEWTAGTERPLPPGTVPRTEKDFELRPGAAREFAFKGPGAIREIALDCDFKGWRDTVPMPDEIRVTIDFDGERTVDVPVTAFFGAGSSLRDFMTRYCSLKDKTFKARWPMPFRKSARVALRNCGKYAQRVRSFSVAAGDCAWRDGRSLHFAASDKNYRRISTRENGTHRDLNYLTVAGRAGKLVGCGVSVFNSAPMWWGEGDEKIYVDGERVPSYIGTGTEDHFGYAWCRPETFSHPLLAQPDGSGNWQPGAAVNIRHRVLDAIPFGASLVFDMELWHWRECVVDYDAFCWYYVKPGPEDRTTVLAAPSDGETPAWPALQKAIDETSAAGGGTVVVPKGRYLVAMVRMKDDVTLRLEKDAVLLASTNHFDYDPAPTTRNLLAVLRADGARNIAVVGEGTIDGRGDACGYHEEGPNRWRLIHFKKCSGVRVEGVRLVNSNYWTSFYECCRGVTLRNLTIRSQTNFNNDGIDLEVADALVENCDIDSDDDAVCFKSHDSTFVCSNVTVRNCRISSHCNCIKFGTATCGIFRDIDVRDCTLCTRRSPGRRDWRRWPAVDSTDWSISGIAVEMVDGGQVENVKVRNITVENGVICPLFVRLGARRGRAAGLPKGPSFLRGVLIEDVRWTTDEAASAARLPIILSGIPGMPIEDLTVRNVSVPFVAAGSAGDESRRPPENEKGYPEAFMFGHLPSWGIFARHIRGLRLENCDLRLVSGTEKRDKTHFEDVTMAGEGGKVK